MFCQPVPVQFRIRRVSVSKIFLPAWAPPHAGGLVEVQTKMPGFLSRMSQFSVKAS
jgi:hypothetical protein